MDCIALLLVSPSSGDGSEPNTWEHTRVGHSILCWFEEENLPKKWDYDPVNAHERDVQRDEENVEWGNRDGTAKAKIVPKNSVKRFNTTSQPHFFHD